MEVNHKMINGVALHDPFEDEEEEEEEDFIQKVGMGRSYDCVFCRRGFTTAQALGGHMNVHRRDRATKHHNPRNYAKHSSSSSSSPYNSVRPLNPHDHASRAYNLGPPSRSNTVFFDVMSLGPQGDSDGGEEVGRASQGVGEKGEEDLDLELRLGYYPYW